MEIKASLNNLRISPRKVRSVTNLIKGMRVPDAKSQLAFLVKKPAPIILKLLNSAANNAKQPFDLKEENLYIKQILVEAGPSLKRWLPRAMGRATPILKRTSAIKLILEEVAPGVKKARKKSRPQIVKPEEALPGGEMPQEAAREPEREMKVKTPSPRPFGSSSESKKRNFSRQTFGNIKKMFRRKSI